MEITQKRPDLIPRVIIFVIGIVLATMNHSMGYTGELAVPIAWFILAVSLYLVITYRKKWELLILFLFLAYYNYSFTMANYISPIDSYFTIYSTFAESYQTENIVLIYMTLLCVFAPKTVTVEPELCIYEREDSGSELVPYAISIILVFILIFGYGRPEQFGQRGDLSSIYEYSIVFFIVGFVFSINKKTDNVLTVLLLLFAFQNFLFGGRVTGVQLIVILFLMRYSHKMTFGKVLPLAIAFVLLMQFVGATRGNYSNMSIVFTNMIESFKAEKLMNDTAYSAYHTSITFVLRESTGWEERLRIFKNFLLSMLLGGGVKDSNLSTYTQRRYIHYGGGFLPVYFHFFLGYFGVVLSSLLTNFYVKMIGKLKKSSGRFAKCVVIYIVTTISRWYLYSPSNMIRGVMLLGVVYFVFKCVDDLLRHREKYSEIIGKIK